MNGYTYTKAWYNFASKNPRLIKPIHHAVIHWVFEKANECKWADEFELKTVDACRILGITDRDTYQKAFRALVDFGAVRVIQEGEGLYVQRWVSLTDCPVYLPKNQVGTTVGQGVSKSVDLPKIPVGQPNILPKKPTSKEVPYIYIDTKETKHNNVGKKADLSAGVSVFPFEDFWEAYGKKEDRKDCEAKWSKLTDKDRAAIMADIPRYRATIEDVRYQKFPLTYLNKKSWLDERTVAPLPNSETPKRRMVI